MSQNGHPDKICDQISDAILDAALTKDKYSRVAVETMVTKNFIALAGEVTCRSVIPYEKITRHIVKSLGYTDKSYQFTHESPIILKIHSQSPEIAIGVDALGAGDQGMMFGYACDETQGFMPAPIALAHKIVETIDQVRENKILSYLRPDGKAQVTLEYENGKPKRVERIVVAVPHDERVTLQQVKEDIYQKVIVPVSEVFGFKVSQKLLTVNGTGVWHFGGPAADTGVTGRKIVVDGYGSIARVGGGAFSGKDPTKVDRSGAYAARYIAKNIVAAKLAKKCEVRLAYVIGAKKPLMQEAETFGTETKPTRIIRDFMNQVLDTSVAGILRDLNLLRPIYLETASYGHFGRNGFPWEKLA